MNGGVLASGRPILEDQVQNPVQRESHITTLAIPTWARRKAGSRAGPIYATTRRVLDLFISISALTFLAPLMLFIAIAIKLASPGPVFFAHQRTGRNGKRFNVFKFRTMVIDAEARKAELAAFNEVKFPEFKMTNDPRITRVGRFLRRTSLDELPQLLNILRGEMTLVGPRPSSVPVDKYLLWQRRRLEVTPGITGPTQVWQRHADFLDKCALDIAYIEHRSLLLDLYVIYQTARVVLLAPSGK